MWVVEHAILGLACLNYLILNILFGSRLFWRGCRALCYLLYFKFTNANVVSRFRQMLAKFPNRVMYVNATNDEEWTFQQVKWWFLIMKCFVFNILIR